MTRDGFSVVDGSFERRTVRKSPADVRLLFVNVTRAGASLPTGAAGPVSVALSPTNRNVNVFAAGLPVAKCVTLASSSGPESVIEGDGWPGDVVASARKLRAAVTGR